MGALHQGHISLIEYAVEENDVSCASIFINPLQFNNPKDLEKYPDTMDSDIAMLEAAGCDMVFTGTLNQYFPEVDDTNNIIMKDPGAAAVGLEGVYRPGHLQGVVTIVERLFQASGSCKAYFGEKDFQQTMIVKDLAISMAANGLDIKIQVCPTIREASGLAMSSRNRRLDQAQKQLASKIYQALTMAKVEWAAGIHDPMKLEKIMNEIILVPGIKVEYATVRDEAMWTADTPVTPIEKPRGLIAAQVGGVRLIDNLYLGLR